MGLRAQWQRTFYGIKDHIKIYDTAFDGEAMTLTAGAEPFSFDHQEITSESNEGILNPYANRIMKGVLDFNFKVETSAEQTLHADMLDTDDQRFKIVWEQDDSVYWQGYIDTKKRTWQERPGYTATIRATDFDLLKDIEYTSDGTVSGDLLSGREKQAEIIAALLDNLNFDINIESETAWIIDGQTSADDYLEQSYKDKFALRVYARTGDESDEPITVYEALEMATEGLLVMQIGGVWKLRQIPSYDDPSDVYQFVYNSSGIQQSGGSVDLRQTLQTSIDDGDTTVSWESGNDGYPSIHRARVKYNHRTKVSGIKLPANIELVDSGTETFDQLFIGNGSETIQISFDVYAETDTDQTSMDARFRIKIDSYWLQDDGSWSETTNNFYEVTLLKGKPLAGGGNVWRGSVNLLTDPIPNAADGTLDLVFAGASGNVDFADETLYTALSFTINNYVPNESSTSIDYQLTQSGGRLGLDLPVSLFGDGPTGYSRGAISTDSAGDQLTADDWARRGEMSFINYHNNLLRDYIDSQRSWTRRINAQMWIGYDPEKIGVYDGSNYMYAGGSYRNGRWTPTLFRVNIQTATDTFQDLPKFEQTGTSGSSSGSIVDIVEQNDNTYPWQRTIISEVGALPGSPSTGDRHIFEDNVRVWNGTEWLTFEPEEGWTLYNEELGKYMVYETRDTLDWYVWDGLNFFQNTDTDYSTISSGDGDTGYRGTYYGFNATGTGDGQSKLGYDTSGDIGDYTSALGYQALKDNIYNNVVGIGRGAVATANNQFIVAQTNVNATPLITGNFSTGLTTLQSLEIGEAGHGFDSSGNVSGGTGTFSGEVLSETQLRVGTDWVINDANGIYPGSSSRGKINVSFQAGGAQAWVYTSGNVSNTDGFHSFNVDGSEIINISQNTNVVSGDLQVNSTTVIDSSRNFFGVNGTFTGTLDAPNIIDSTTTYTASTGVLSFRNDSTEIFNESGFYVDWTLSTPGGGGNTIDVINGRTVEFRGLNDVTVTSDFDAGAYFVDIDVQGVVYQHWELSDGSLSYDVDDGDRVEFTDSGASTVTVTDQGGGLYTVNVSSTDTQPRSDEYIEDVVGAMVSGNTETLISVTYQDGDGTIDFVVDNDLSNYDNTTSSFLTSGDLDGYATETYVDNAVYGSWNLFESGAVGSGFDIQGDDRITFLDGGATSISITDEGGNEYQVQITSTDTTYTAGSGLDLNGTEFSLDTGAIFSGFSVVIDDGGVGTPFEMPDSNALLTIKAGDRISLSQNNGEITVTADVQGGGTMSDWSLLVEGVSEQTVTDSDNVNFTGGTGIIADYVSAAVDYRIDTSVVPRLNVNNDFGTNTLTAGNLLNGSDRKWKTEFSDDYDALYLVGQLQDKFYKKYDRYYEFGFVAQDLQGVDMIDNLVFDMEHGLSVNYNGITALNSGAINKLNGKVDSEIERLEKQISALQDKVEGLKNAN